VRQTTTGGTKQKDFGDVNGTNGTYIDQHGMANGICPKIAILRQNMSVNITGFWSAPIFGESIFWSKKDPKNGEALYNPAASDITLSLAQASMASIILHLFLQLEPYIELVIVTVPFIKYFHYFQNSSSSSVGFDIASFLSRRGL
jgi:hypothetical protein